MTKSSRDKNWEALSEQLMALQARAFHVAFRVLCDSAAAEDAVQEANIKAMQKLRKGFIPEDLARWFMVTTINTARNALRTERRLKMREEKVSLQSETETDERKEDAARDLRAAMAQLDESERLPISLHYEMGLSVVEVSRMLKVNRGALEYRMNKGLERLRALLGSEGRSLTPAVVVSLLQAGVWEPAPPALLVNSKALFSGQRAAAASVSGKASVALGLWTAVVACGLVAVGAIVWTQSAPEPGLVTPTETSQTIHNPQNQETNGFDKTWTFEAGVPGDIQLCYGDWAWWPADGDTAGALALHPKIMSLILLPQKMPQTPVLVELTERNGILPTSAAFKGYWADVAAELLPPCVVATKGVNMEQKDVATVGFYFVGKKIVHTHSGKIWRVHEYDRPYPTGRAALSLRNVVIEKITIRSVREEELPANVLRVVRDGLAGGSVATKEGPYSLSVRNKPEPLNRFWSFAKEPAEGFKVMTSYPTWKWIPPKDEQPGYMLFEKGLEGKYPPVLIPVETSIHPFVISVKIKVETPGVTCGISGDWAYDQANRQALWRGPTVNLKLGHWYWWHFLFDRRWEFTLAENELLALTAHPRPFPSDKVLLWGYEQSVEEIRIREISRDEIPEALRDPPALLKKLRETKAKTYPLPQWSP